MNFVNFFTSLTSAPFASSFSASSSFLSLFLKVFFHVLFYFLSSFFRHTLIFPFLYSFPLSFSFCLTYSEIFQPKFFAYSPFLYFFLSRIILYINLVSLFATFLYFHSTLMLIRCFILRKYQ